MASSGFPLPAVPGTVSPSPDASSMLGLQAPAPERQAEMQDLLRAEVGRIHQLISQVETLARSHPEAASHFNRARQALGQAIMAVTTTLTRGQEGPMPPVIG